MTSVKDRVDEIDKKFEKDIAAAMESPMVPASPTRTLDVNFPSKRGETPNPIKEHKVSVVDYSHVDGYGELSRILGLAYDQSASGKGDQRHAHGPTGFKPWDHQPILLNARQVGPGGPAQQVMKKTQEAVTFAGNRNFAAAKADVLGAIVYAAALYKLLEEMEQV